MLDIKFIRENKEVIKDGARKKHIDFNVESLIVIDAQRRELVTSMESKKSDQNRVSQEIQSTQDQTLRAKLIEDMRVLKEDIKKDEEKLSVIMKEWQTLMVAVPNIPDISVPEGATDAENVEVRTWGEIPQFTFQPKSHIDLMLAHDLVDFDRGTKVAGFRGYFLKNEAVELHFALWQYLLQSFVKKGFNPMMVPSLVRRETLLGTGYIPQGEDDLYKTQDSDYLSGTGEVATMGYYSDEIVDKSQLPMKMLSFSTCFRREAGSHGKDTRGLIRVHEFFKWEQVILCEADHMQSVAFHEELTKNSEELMQALNLPYHVIVVCGGDLGLGQVKKYDIECWVPSENTYRETHSASYFHDFQTRRLNIRYRDAEGNLKFVHSLNNTAAATPRLLVSIIENYQQEDGTIKIPEVLRPFMGGKEFIGK